MFSPPSPSALGFWLSAFSSSSFVILAAALAADRLDARAYRVETVRADSERALAKRIRFALRR